MSGKDPREFNVPQVELLRPDQIDNLGRAILSLTREVAVLTDRVLVLEAVLEQQGVTSHEEVETFAPDDAFEARSKEAMEKILQGVLDSLSGSDG